MLRRKPLIWDNLHANDYDGRRFYCGPYAGRSPELRHAVSGLLSNPNCEFPLNYVPLRTMADLVHGDGNWEPRKAYETAMQEWLQQFATIGQALTLDDLILFCDCYYLPHEEGTMAEALYKRVRDLLTTNPTEWTPQQVTAFREPAARLRQFCVRLTELRHRSLFYALSRRIWELREELDLLEQYIEGKCAHGRASIPSLTSHLPGTYRGGMVAKLQRLLIQNPDGTFAPARWEAVIQSGEDARRSTAPAL